ncbi:Beta-catenin-like protein [Paramyrothecium foliicola]|nr:Beta-catenin-like protein [Paramyrothecium foliicola]
MTFSRYASLVLEASDLSLRASVPLRHILTLTPSIPVYQANESWIQSETQVSGHFPSIRFCSRSLTRRKFWSSDEIYKSAKLDDKNEGRRHAELDEPDNDSDGDFGPEMPPEGDGPGVADEEGGRFFGGGISKQESEILDFVDGAEASNPVEKVDAAWLRKMALNFEKRISKNAELRAKYENDPQKFIASEGDLDADIKGLSVLSEHPDLYSEFVALGCVGSLVGLLAHDNTDIAIDVIEILGELTDDDVDADDAQWNALADALIDAGLLELLVSNLSRLNEVDESDRNGVYHTLGVIENLCSRSAIATRIGNEAKLLQWLLSRIQRRETTMSQNKQYAAEVLAILSQASADARRQILNQDAIDILLQLVAQYRKRDPDRGSEEEEYMENLFEALTCLVDEARGKLKMLESEGVELCLIMLKEGKLSKIPALRLLDHAAGGLSSGDVCSKLVQAGGLKTTFTVFIKTQDKRLIAHLLAIFASLLRLLPADSSERIRTLAKFVEKDYEKIAKLVMLRSDYSSRVKRAEEEFRTRKDKSSDLSNEELEVELLSRRLDAGLHVLQHIDTILAWLVAEDSGAKQRIRQLLANRDESLEVIKITISEQIRGLDTGEDDSRELKDMLSTLLEFVS